MKKTDNLDRKLYWLTNHFTYYHDYLFQHLNEECDLDLIVCYRELVLKSHPWEDLEESTYKYIELPKNPIGLDKRILWKALVSNDYFVVSGWDNLMYLMVVSILAVRNKAFGLFTDTPRKPESSMKQYLKRQWLAFVFRKRSRAKLMVTGKIGVARTAEFLRIDTSKIANFPFATNNQVFTPLASSTISIQNQLVKFLSVGRLDFVHKGQDVALRALAGLLSRGFSRFEYLIAGVGDDHKRMIELVKELGLQNHVKSLGWVEISDLPRLFNMAHFTLHSSHEDPFPNAILESLSCGVPVIGSDAAGSVVERVVSDFNGYVFQDNNILNLEEILSVVTKMDDAKFQQLKNNSRNSALQWTVNYNVDVINSIFTEV